MSEVGHDWSFATGEDVVYGVAFDEEDAWLALPRAMLEEMADTRGAVERAKTWGDVRRAVPASRLDEMAEMMADWGEFDEGGTHEGLTFATIPEDEEFVCPKYDEDQFPDWPDRAMLQWLGWGILSGYGGEESSMASHWYRIYDIEGLLAGLRSVGATCEQDDELIEDAFNGR